MCLFVARTLLTIYSLLVACFLFIVSFPTVTDMAEKSLSPTVAAVAIKPAQFTPETPDLWFAQIEAQFQLAGVTDKITRFYHVVAHLPPTVTQSARHLVLKTPVAGDYEKLKQHIISVFTVPATQRIKSFLDSEPLGDRRTSVFFESIDEFVFNLWLAKLPATLQPIVMALKQTPGITIETILTVADNMHKATKGPSIAEINRSPRINQSNHRARSVSRCRNDGKRRDHSQSRRSSESSNYCWFHHRFGEKARKCQKPCSFDRVGNLRQ